MSEYTPTIGLEIHAELKTRTKMFCDSKNDADETKPNVNICPVCMAHPGTLPVINREAVMHVLKVGTALGAKLADYTEFDRKNYFYPDLPKGYQLSQYEYPLVSGGTLNGVAITRVHLEEDTASSLHDENTGVTTIDYNRAGVPLMELVTEPVITSSEQAGAFARELQLLLRTLGVSEANMEKGEMRVEANISISKDKNFGTKVEIKNLNSFRAMERAVEYEIKRQQKVLKSGEQVVQETRGWDEGKQSTFPQRVKEGSADYRYFPDPDLPSLKLSEIPDADAEMLKKSLPELPWQRRQRYNTFGVKMEDADLFVREKVLGSFFDKVVLLLGEAKEAIKTGSNYLANDLVKLIRDIEKRDAGYQSEIKISAENFTKIIKMIIEKRVSSRVAKDILLASFNEGIDPEAYASEKGLFQASAGANIDDAVKQVISTNGPAVADYKAGKATAIQYLVGQTMKTLKGAGNPIAIRESIERIISSEI